MQILLRGGRLVDEEKDFSADLMIEGEKICKIADEIPLNQIDQDCRVINLHGKLLMPGVIDAHTHYQLKSRNTVTADDFESGSISAACGGVTTFIDYSDHLLDYSLAEAVQKRIQEAEKKTVLDFTLHQTITHFDQQVNDELADLLELGISSIKIFTTYRREGYMIPEDEWEQVFLRLKELQLLLTVHAEDDGLITRLETEYQKKGLVSPEMHPQIRPVESERLAVEQVSTLARQVGMPLYIAHLSSEAGLQALKKVQAEGGQIFAETTPHYLLLDESYLHEPDAQKYVMTPPLRKVRSQQALWDGLAGEWIQVVVTDHCAFSLEQKLSDDNCLMILPGLPGSETLLPLIHHFGVVKRKWSYSKLARVLSANPAKIFGLYPTKGSLQPGTDADLVIFDPKKEITLTQDIMHSQAGYTPYEGFKLLGYPIMTFLRGQLLVKDGHFIGQKGRGQFIKAEKSSLYDD